jgi:hypothetical protein
VERKSSSSSQTQIFKKPPLEYRRWFFYYPHVALQRLGKPKTKKAPTMNTTTLQKNPQTRAPQFGGNSVTESESLLTLLFHRYQEAGLQSGDAWDAALADYAHGFNTAA